MVGSIDGAGNGTFEGVGVEGFGDGTEFGNIEGTFDGIFDGLTVGKGTGIEVGLSEEAGTATRDGSMVGIFVVGTGVDFLEGLSVGNAEGYGGEPRVGALAGDRVELASRLETVTDGDCVCVGSSVGAITGDIVSGSSTSIMVIEFDENDAV